MKWVLTVPVVIEAADDMSKEQLVQMLVQQQVLHGAADAFTLEPVEEVCVASDEDKAPNGAAEVNEKIDDIPPVETCAENQSKMESDNTSQILNSDETKSD